MRFLLITSGVVEGERRSSYFFRAGERVPLLFTELMTKYLLYNIAFAMRSGLFVSISS